MKRKGWGWTWALVALLCALSSIACVTVVTETAKKALEDRSTEGVAGVKAFVDIKPAPK